MLKQACGVRCLLSPAPAAVLFVATTTSNGTPFSAHSSLEAPPQRTARKSGRAVHRKTRFPDGAEVRHRQGHPSAVPAALGRRCVSDPGYRRHCDEPRINRKACRTDRHELETRTRTLLRHSCEETHCLFALKLLRVLKVRLEGWERLRRKLLELRIVAVLEDK